MVHAGLLTDKINQIRTDRSNGASQIARNALDVLKFFVKTTKTSNLKDFKQEFKEVGLQLFESRPNMAPVQNLIAQAVYEVYALTNVDIVSAKKFALSTIDTLTKQSKTAIKDSATHAALFIEDSSCIASCSDSSTVCQTLKLAKQQGKRFNVLVAESKTGTTRYGRVMAHFLYSNNVDATVFPDNKITTYVSKADCVLVGADSLLCDGSVINGLPSYELAVAAKQSNVPFYSVCETTKANILSYLGKTIKLKKRFDCVPANMVTQIITENGLLGTQKLVEVMKAKSKFFEIFGVN
jgi:translation initiation factor 2B subunit (eIF-2B alpha/beta/delta family)